MDGTALNGTSERNEFQHAECGHGRGSRSRRTLTGVRGTPLLLLVAGAVLVACTSDTEPMPDSAATVVTHIRFGTEVTWQATSQPTERDLATLREEFGAERAALLVPGDPTWSDPVTVEARVDQFVPDPGYVTAGVVVRSDGNGDVLVSVQRGELGPLDCEERPDGTFDAVIVRSADGCVSTDGGPVVHLMWNEGGFRWTAQSSTYQDAEALIAEVNRWRLLTPEDL